MYIKYTNTLHCKTLKNLPNMGIFGLEINYLATLIQALIEDRVDVVADTFAATLQRHTFVDFSYPLKVGMTNFFTLLKKVSTLPWWDSISRPITPQAETILCTRPRCLGKGSGIC
jgi:hypothetical protein